MMLPLRVYSLLNHYRKKFGKDKTFRLVLLCSSQSFNSSYLATALAKFERSITPSISHLKDCIFQRITENDSSTTTAQFLPCKTISFIDTDKSYIRIISSEKAGSGKSLNVSRIMQKFKPMSTPDDVSVCTVVNRSYESDCCELCKAATRMSQSPSPADYGLYHFDIMQHQANS